MKNFVTFNGSMSGVDKESYSYRCWGLLVKYEDYYFFVYRPMYEEVVGDFTSMQSGVSVTVMPVSHDNMQICRLLLCSGDVRVGITEVLLGDLVNSKREIELILGHAPQVKVDGLESLEMRLLTNIGPITLTSNRIGSLDIVIEKPL